MLTSIWTSLIKSSQHLSPRVLSARSDSWNDTWNDQHWKDPMLVSRTADFIRLMWRPHSSGVRRMFFPGRNEGVSGSRLSLCRWHGSEWFSRPHGSSSNPLQDAMVVSTKMAEITWNHSDVRQMFGSGEQLDDLEPGQEVPIFPDGWWFKPLGKDSLPKETLRWNPKWCFDGKTLGWNPKWGTCLDKYSLGLSQEFRADQSSLIDK